MEGFKGGMCEVDFEVWKVKEYLILEIIRGSRIYKGIFNLGLICVVD